MNTQDMSDSQLSIWKQGDTFALSIAGPGYGACRDFESKEAAIAALEELLDFVRRQD